MRQRKYETLPSSDDNSGLEEIPVKVHKPSKRKKLLNPVTHFLPEQFNLKERPIPWKAIGYAAILFILGTILLLCGCLIHIDHIDNNVWHFYFILLSTMNSYYFPPFLEIWRSFMATHCIWFSHVHSWLLSCIYSHSNFPRSTWIFI